MGIKRSEIWKISKEELEIIVKNSQTITAVLKYFNLSNKGRNYKTLQSRLLEDKIDFSHITLGLNNGKGKNFIRDKIPLNEILIEKSSYNTFNLKQRLFKENILEERCCECGLNSLWNNKPISLQLDHINGISNDHRIENLRILCPNCHSQTETFAGRKNKQPPKEKLPRKKASRSTKINWPELNILIKMLETDSYTEVGRKLGVSDNAVRKRLKKFTNNDI